MIKIKIARDERIFKGFVYLFLLLTTFLFIYPFWNVLVISFNSGIDSARGSITFWPRDFTLDNYRIVFKNPNIMSSLKISVYRTLLGTFLGVVVNGMAAYALSKPKLIGKNIYLSLFVFTMYFNGGLIPFFLVVRELNLLNTFWVLVIPFTINVWNLIIFRSFFSKLPSEIEESAQLDGASHFQIFFKIVIPISKPVFATIALFTAVFHWNAWFHAVIFINDSNLLPIQAILREVINSNAVSEALRNAGGAAADYLRANTVTTKSIISSTMMVATIPIIVIYPFLQRFFVKGVTLGSLKG